MGASSGAPLFRQVVACPTGQVDVPTAPGSAQAHGADDSLRAHAWCPWTSRCAHGPCQRPPGHSASAEVAVVDGALRLPEAQCTVDHRDLCAGTMAWWALARTMGTA